MAFRRPSERAPTERFNVEVANERAFIVSELFTGISANGGTVNVHLSNSDSNTKSAVLTAVRTSSNTPGVGKLYDTFSTSPSNGTALTVDNLLLDQPDDSDTGSMTATKNVDFTASNTHSAIVIGGGVGANAIGETARTQDFVLEPGREVVLEFQNDADTQAKAALDFVYYELPELFTE